MVHFFLRHFSACKNQSLFGPSMVPCQNAASSHWVAKTQVTIVLCTHIHVDCCLSLGSYWLELQQTHQVLPFGLNCEFHWGVTEPQQREGRWVCATLTSNGSIIVDKNGSVILGWRDRKAGPRMEVGNSEFPWVFVYLGFGSLEFNYYCLIHMRITCLMD